MAQNKNNTTTVSVKEVLSAQYNGLRNKINQKYNYRFDGFDYYKNIELETLRQDFNKKHMYTTRHNFGTLTLHVAQNMQWQYVPSLNRVAYVSVDGAIPESIYSNYTHLDYEKDGEIYYSHKYQITDRKTGKPRWVAKKTKNLLTMTQFTWQTMLAFEYSIGGLEIYLTKDQVQHIKTTWEDTYIDGVNKDGEPITITVPGYNRYHNIVKFALQRGWEVGVTVVGVRRVSGKDKTSFQDFVKFEGYEKKANWYLMARAGYQVTYKPYSSNDLEYAMFSIEHESFKDNVIFNINDELYTYYDLSSAFIDENNDNKVVKYIWEITDELDGDESQFKNIGRFGQYIGTYDRKYVSIMRGLMKHFRYKNLQGPIFYKYRDIAPTHKLDAEADDVIRSYYDIDMYGESDAVIGYYKTLTATLGTDLGRQPNVYYVPNYEMVKRVIGNRLIMLELIKEKTISDDDIEGSEAWNDMDAKSLGISWAKDLKTNDAHAHATTFGNIEYMESEGDDETLGFEGFSGRSGLPTQLDVDAKLDGKHFKELYNQKINDYAEAKEYGLFAHKYNKLKSEVEESRESFKTKREKYQPTLGKVVEYYKNGKLVKVVRK